MAKLIATILNRSQPLNSSRKWWNGHFIYLFAYFRTLGPHNKENSRVILASEWDMERQLEPTEAVGDGSQRGAKKFIPTFWDFSLQNWWRCCWLVRFDLEQNIDHYWSSGRLTCNLARALIFNNRYNSWIPQWPHKSRRKFDEENM